MLMLAIARASDEKGTCRRSTKELAASARMSRTNVWRLLGELESTGWIAVEHPQKKSGKATIQLALARLQQRSEESYTPIEKSIPRCGGKSTLETAKQQQLDFSPEAVEPAPRMSAFERERFLERKAAALQQRQNFGNNLPYSAGPFGSFGGLGRKRW